MNRTSATVQAWLRSSLILGLLGLGTARADLNLSGRTLQWESGNAAVWQREFPASMGPLTEPLAVGTTTYLGVGPVVYAFGPAGNLLGRADLPGQSTSLDSVSGVVAVSTQGHGYTERFTLAAPQNNLSLPVVERAVMPPDSQITGWLAGVADSVPAPQLSQAARDFPDNPFVALREAEQLNKAGDHARALSAVRHTLGSRLPFTAWTQLAARLDRAGYPAAANLALERATRDAAARGIDPEIPVSRAALRAYGDPVGYAATLIQQGHLARADAWMNFLRGLYPRFEGHSDLYRRYAALLDAQGRSGEAEGWRQFGASLRAGSLYNLGPDDTQTVRDAARLATLALLLGLLAAYLTLAARAWKAQGEDTRPYGGRWASVLKRPLTRARLGVLSYASLPERLTLVILGAALLTALVGWQWANQTGRGLQAPALNMGTYGGGWYSAHIDDLNLRPGPDTAILNGLAAQLGGDDTTARDSYTAAGPDACALNNLGVVSQNREDQPQALELYRQALTLEPDSSAASYNLGLDQRTPDTLFQQQYRWGEPRLCYPNRRNLARMVSGDLSVTLRRDLSDPLGFLRRDPQQSNPAGSVRMGWAVLGTITLLAALAFLLLVPRAAGSRRLGRPALYRLLAFLFPGSALLGNPWGGVLLLTWAATVSLLAPLTHLLRFDFLPQPQQPAVRNVLALLLITCYAINTLGLFLIEANTFRQRRLERAVG
ncbi:hypothetical protein [Deinococcus sp.]|uniref:hypothetical protein n=1 Tax=Deinococcus sp. TaxID=47478 RepID=UPI0025BFF0BB|nr:hypothetical protein [Deinococcus sp.]